MKKQSFNIKMNQDKLFVLCEGNSVYSEPCIGIKRLAEGIFLLKNESSRKILNTNTSNEIEIENESEIRIWNGKDYVQIREDNKHKFIDLKTLKPTFEISVGQDMYANVYRFGKFALYEGKLYSDEHFLIDLNLVNHVILNDTFYVLKFDGLVIFYRRSFPSCDFYCLPESSIKGEIKNLIIGSCLLVNTTQNDYIFDRNGELKFEGSYGNYYVHGSIKIKNESSDFFWFEEQILGPLNNFPHEIGNTCFSNNNKLVLFGVDNFLMIDIVNNQFAIIPIQVANLKHKKGYQRKIVTSKYDESFAVLTDGFKDYYFFFEKKELIELPDGWDNLKNNQLSYIGFDGEFKKLEFDCDEIIDYSYLQDSVIVIYKKGSEYVLVSSTSGKIKTFKKPIAFEQHWGGFVMLDPQPGKRMELFYYDEKTDKLLKFPMKVDSIGVRLKIEMDISLNGIDPFTSLDFKKGEVPCID